MKIDWDDWSYAGEISNKIAEVIGLEARGDCWFDAASNQITPYRTWEAQEGNAFRPSWLPDDALFAARMLTKNRRAPLRLEYRIDGWWYASFIVPGHAKQVLESHEDPGVAICKAILKVGELPDRKRLFPTPGTRHPDH